LDLKTSTVGKKKVCDISHHAAQETDGARRRDVARRACGSNAGHENGRVAKPERTGRDRIVGRGRRKHATRGDPNEWGDDIPLWESHPSRSHAPAREKTPRQRRQRREKEQVERTTKDVRGRKLQEAPKERAIPSQTWQYGGGIFVLHVLGERTREECGQAMFHLR